MKQSVPVLVIVGNPPYDRTSHNANPHSDRLLEDFYALDGARLPERNSGPLKDDYLRFIRWSVWKLLEQEGSPGHGVLAFVTNRAFIERKLHRAVRHFLLRKFDEIRVFDLHGDQREWFRDRTDEKVFKDVQAGIALTIFIKRPNARGDNLASVQYRETFGTRAEKLHACHRATLADESWQVLQPHPPLWLFVPYVVPAEYDLWPTMTQLFPKNVIGVQTHRDQLVVAFTERELRARLEKFADQSVPDSYWEAQQVRSNRDWKLRQTRRAIQEESPRNVMRWTYRPFDRRWVAFDERLIDYTRTEVYPHLVGHPDNLAIALHMARYLMDLADKPDAGSGSGPFLADIWSGICGPPLAARSASRGAFEPSSSPHRAPTAIWNRDGRRRSLALPICSSELATVSKPICPRPQIRFCSRPYYTSC